MSMELINELEQTVRLALPKEWVNNVDMALAQQHPLSKGFPLMNPFHVLLITLAYLVSLPIGIMIMKNREKFELKAFSLLHNGFLIILSTYMGVETLHQAIRLGYSVFGNGAAPDPAALPLAQVLWVFYVSKPVEFVDTWIMILKKNNHQVSFLHVYHHATIFCIWWAVIYYAPGGESYFSAAQNSFVHVLMYTYYFMTALKITVPYKAYITQIQMTQFALNFIQACYCVTHDTPHYPKWLGWLLFFYMITLLALFYNFYRKNLSAAARARAKNAQQNKPKAQ